MCASFTMKSVESEFIFRKAFTARSGSTESNLSTSPVNPVHPASSVSRVAVPARLDPASLTLPPLSSCCAALRVLACPCSWTSRWCSWVPVRVSVTFCRACATWGLCP